MAKAFDPTLNAGLANDISLEIDLSSTEGEKVWLDKGFTILVGLSALASVAVLFWMSVVVAQQAWPAIQKYGAQFLWSTDWDIGQLLFGALPFIYGTIVTSMIALLIAVPVGIAVALMTSENLLPEWVKSPLAFTVELIAAIPSVIIGLWGIFVFTPVFEPVAMWLYQTFDWLIFFSTPPLGQSVLVAGIILAIMVLPTMAAISREVLLAIPAPLRSASMALGATRWETIFRVMLPTGASGILGAAVLALGRALGETMAVTMVIGNSLQISPSLLDPGTTIAANIALQFPEALDPLHIGALMYLALILFVLTLVVNVAAVFIVQFVSSKGIGG